MTNKQKVELFEQALKRVVHLSQFHQVAPCVLREVREALEESTSCVDSLGHAELDDFDDQLDLFNSLLPHYSQFQYTTSRKEHEDEFGDTVFKGDTYFKRGGFTGAFDDVIKVSSRSMNTILRMFVNRNPIVHQLGTAMLQKHRDRLHDSANRMPELVDVVR